MVELIKWLAIAVWIIGPHIIRCGFRWMLKQKLYTQSIYQKEYEDTVNKIFLLDVTLIVVMAIQGLVVTVILTNC